VPVRVELLEEVLGDLEAARRTGRIKDYLAKLVRLEDQGPAVGLPLGHKCQGHLTGRSKIVVGHGNWRIVFRMRDGETAVVGVIGDRDDESCYRELAKRLGASDRLAQTVSLAAAFAQLLRSSRTERKR
jgi:hypothetical protein